MVAENLRHADPNIPIREVVASRGKLVSAEPVAGLYDPNVDKVRHLIPEVERGEPALTDLEDQMCMFDMSGYTGERSPDRADALIWALHHLMIEPQVPMFGLDGHQRQSSSVKCSAKSAGNCNCAFLHCKPRSIA